MYTASFEILDERFEQLIFGNVHLEKLYTGCRWAEGPAYFAAGKYLIWSDIPNDRVMRFDETDGSTSVFLAPAMNHNGHTVDREGRLICCEHRGRCVSRIEHDGSRTVLADRYQGKRLNSPNDVVVKSDGSIWFTDPSYGIDSDYEGDAAPSEIGASHVYRLDPASGEVTAVATDFDEAERPRLLARRKAALYRRHGREPYQGWPAPYAGRRSLRRRPLARSRQTVRNLHGRPFRRLSARYEGQYLDFGRRRRPRLCAGRNA